MFMTEYERDQILLNLDKKVDQLDSNQKKFANQINFIQEKVNLIEPMQEKINQLDSKKLSINKEAFFDSISDVLNKFPESTRNRIKSAHYYEIALVAFREENYGIGIKYLLKGFKSPMSVLDLIERYKNR